MKKCNFKCESIHWGLNIHLLQMEGAAEPKAGANWRFPGRERSSDGSSCVLLLGFVKMPVLNRSYIWGQVTAITGDTASPQIIPRDGNDIELT